MKQKEKSIDIASRMEGSRGSLFRRMFRRKDRKRLGSSLYELIAKGSFEEDSLSEIINIALRTLKGDFKLKLYFADANGDNIDPYYSYSLNERKELINQRIAKTPSVFERLDLESDNPKGICWNRRKNEVYIYNLLPHDFNITKKIGDSCAFEEECGIIVPLIFQKRMIGVLEISGNIVRMDCDNGGTPFNLILYSAALARIIAMHIELQSDPLTLLGTRRKYDIVLPLSISRCIKERGRMSLIYLDADHFKKVNDTYGHSAGDAVLRFIAKGLIKSTREVECEVFRIGGEEFAIIANTSLYEACQIAKRIAQEIKNGVRVKGNDGNINELKPTVSIGISSIEQEKFREDANVEMLRAALERQADNALYNAKNEYGRDCVVIRDRGSDGSIVFRKI